MAGGKLTPRQKMINMMYLVLTAMLALNVSQEILRALTDLNSSMEGTVKAVEAGNDNLYAMLKSAAAEKERAKEWYQKAQELQPMADGVWQKIEDVKQEIIEGTGGMLEDGVGFKGADNRDVAQGILLNGKDIGGKGMGKEIRMDLIAFRDYMVANTESEAGKQQIMDMFDLEKRPIKQGETPKEWEDRKFGELPMAGVITNLTELQAKVRRAESDMLETYAEGIDAGTVKFTTVVPFVKAKNSYLTPGQNYEAEIFLAAYDDSQNPDFTMNGQPIPAEQVEAGKANVSFPVSGLGPQTFSGSIMLPGAEEAIPFEATYTVVPPTAVISPTKMNVLYRQVDNPLDISVPGAQPEDIVVTGPGIRQVGPGSYVANVTRVDAKTINIGVSVKNEDGSTTSMGSKEFRIKGLPSPEARIYRRNTSGPYSASAISSAEIEAAYPDFPFELDLKVTKFEVIVPGQAPFRITGNRMSSNARAAIGAAKPGSTIIIRNVEAEIVGKGERISNVQSLTLDLN